MESLTILSAVDQVSKHLRKELLRGSFSGTMPGVEPLAKELGVNHKTARAALRQLEDEGLLVDQGKGIQRRIVLPKNHSPSALRIGLLQGDSNSQGVSYVIETRHLLEEAGHIPFFPNKSLEDLGMDPGRVADYITQTDADAWVVSAASRSVLEWFSGYSIPSFALFGRRHGLPIAAAGPDKPPVCAAAARHLISLGHRRIAMLIRRQHRIPKPAGSALAFVNELEAAKIPCGSFNLPDWEESKTGFAALLSSLFEYTPPTALIIDEAFLFNAAVFFLASRGIKIPEDVSLICTDADPSFAWCEPSIAHIRWDYPPVVRRIVQWANNIAQGKKDLRQTLTKAELIEGGTIGPVTLS
ncbi:substrate-binding domain-containing protein [Akkermansiaceae bacterium]|nr:substrate-binding domain-containing protein [Akkermansiaceae bacterium]